MSQVPSLDATQNSFSAEEDDLLFSTLRALSEDFTARAEHKSQRTDDVPLPSLSNVSLWVVWFVSVVGTATCYLFCEVHQVSYPTFPLGFVAALGAQLTLVSSFLVYLSGVHRYGRRAYRFYQPFSGGAQFVTLQGIGSLCLVLSLCLVVMHVELFDVNHIVRGAFVYCALLSLLGNALLMTSIGWFDPRSKKRAHTTVMNMLMRKPNAETALSACLLVAMLALCCAGCKFSALQASVALVTLIVHVINGAIIHFVIGNRHIAGYRDCMTLRRPSIVMVQLWWAWLAFIATMAANVFLVLHPTKHSHMWLVAIVFGDVLSGGIVLLLVRFVKLRSHSSQPQAATSTITQYAGVAAVAIAFTLGACEFALTQRLQSQRDPSGTPAVDGIRSKLVDRHVESSDWTWGDFMQMWLFISKSLSILLPLLTQTAGRVVHGSKFTWFNAPIEHHFRSFVLLQVFGGWLYIIACGCFGLFVLSDNWTFGAIMSLANVFSVLVLSLSIQEFTRVQERESAANSTSAAAVGRAEETSAVPPAEKNKKGLGCGGATSDAEQEQGLIDTQLVNAAIANVLNGSLLLSYLFAASGLALCVLLDTVRTKLWDSNDRASQGLLFALSSACFTLATPTAHFSARQLGMKMFDPFTGGGSYIALQVLGWGLYAVLLVLKALLLVAMYNRKDMRTTRSGAVDRDGYWFTMSGVLDLIPVALITLSNMVEAKRVLSVLRRREMVREAIEGVRSIMRNYATRCHNEDECALARRAFRTVALPAYDAYRLPYTREDLELLPSSARADRAGDGSESNDSDDSDDNFANKETRVRHESVLIIVILMACFSAAFYTIAAFTWNIPIVSLSMASCGFVICALSCITTHAGYGVVLKGEKGFKPFMPFRGGAEYMKLQIAAWTCFSVVLLITLTSVVETVETSVPALLTAAALSIAAQVLLLDSIPRFTMKAPPSYFLEHSGEVVVAVLCFVGAITFGNVYSAFKTFVTSSDASISARALELGRLTEKDLSESDRWMSTKRTRVPFVVAIVGVTLAVPLVLVALGRTTKQVGLAAKNKKQDSLRAGTDKQRADDDHFHGDDLEYDDGATSLPGHVSGSTSNVGSPCDRNPPSGYAKWANHGMLLEAFSNLMQVFLLLAGAILPFTAGYLLYAFSHTVSVHSLENIETGLRYFAVVLLLSLVFSLVPYLLHVGVPQVFITLRFTIVTWAQYGLAVTIACSILLPAVLFPCMGTITSAFLLFALTLVGNFSVCRLLSRVVLSALIGYRTYEVYVRFRQDGARAACGPAALGAYLCDELLLVAWVCYIPTYEGKPYHTGHRRSSRVIDFARRYIFADVVRYFNFQVLVDDESVQLRDGKNQYLFSFHPHGVFPGTALFCSMTDAWKEKIGTNPHTTLATHGASIIFNVPGVRDYNLLLGSMSVARRTIEANFARGNSGIIVTGGQAEMLHTKVSDREMILVTHHLGFIRLALRCKVPLVPLLSFAENNLLGFLQFPRIQKMTLRILGFPFPFIPYGRFGMPVPFRTRLTLVVGKPVPIPADADPQNPEDVQRVAEMYFAEVKELFYRHRAEAGYPDMELVLVNEKEERRKRREAAEKAKAEQSEAAGAATKKQQ